MSLLINGNRPITGAVKSLAFDKECEQKAQSYFGLGLGNVCTHCSVLFNVKSDAMSYDELFEFDYANYYLPVPLLDNRLNQRYRVKEHDASA